MRSLWRQGARGTVSLPVNTCLEQDRWVMTDTDNRGLPRYRLSMIEK